MPLRVRLGKEAVAWLEDHPDVVPAFFEALGRVFSDELCLVRESEPLVVPDKRFVQRVFAFGEVYTAVFEWNHAERSVRVHKCRRADSRPPPQRPAA